MLATSVVQGLLQRSMAENISCCHGWRVTQSTAKGAEVLINNDSRSDWGAWMAGLSGLSMGGLMVYSPNIHEIRGYNRLAKLSSGHMLVFMQVCCGCTSWRGILRE